MRRQSTRPASSVEYSDIAADLGRFRIEQNVAAPGMNAKTVTVLGEGGFGKVIFDSSTGSILKIPHSRKHSNSGEQSAFVHECSMLLKLRRGDDECLVKLFFAAFITGLNLTDHIIQLQAESGKTIDLFDYSKNNTHSNITNPVHPVLAFHFLQALGYLHENGIAHRDLKPENALLVRDFEQPGDWRLKLADFGLAVSFDRQDHYADNRCGTTCLFPPEMANMNFQWTKDSAIAVDRYAAAWLLVDIAKQRPYNHPIITRATPRTMLVKEIQVLGQKNEEKGGKLGSLFLGQKNEEKGGKLGSLFLGLSACCWGGAIALTQPGAAVVGIGGPVVVFAVIGTIFAFVGLVFLLNFVLEKCNKTRGNTMVRTVSHSATKPAQDNRGVIPINQTSESPVSSNAVGGAACDSSDNGLHGRGETNPVEWLKQTACNLARDNPKQRTMPAQDSMVAFQSMLGVGASPV